MDEMWAFPVLRCPCLMFASLMSCVTAFLLLLSLSSSCFTSYFFCLHPLASSIPFLFFLHLLPYSSSFLSFSSSFTFSIFTLMLLPFLIFFHLLRLAATVSSLHHPMCFFFSISLELGHSSPIAREILYLRHSHLFVCVSVLIWEYLTGWQSMCCECV